MTKGKKTKKTKITKIYLFLLPLPSHNGGGGGGVVANFLTAKFFEIFFHGYMDICIMVGKFTNWQS